MEDDDSNVEMTEMTIAETNVNVDTETGLLVSDYQSLFCLKQKDSMKLWEKNLLKKKYKKK